jgi:rod shape determining protein RodA
MLRVISSLFAGFDPLLFGAALCLSLFGVATMYSHVGENGFFIQQSIWLLVSLGVFLTVLIPDYRFLRTTNAAFYAYVVIVVLLVLTPFFAEEILGARQRFDFGFFSLQVSDPAKLILIAVLAKYFAKRHELIGDVRHIIVSGIYTFILFGLVFIQPDFGTAMILFLIWFGMVLVAGIRFRHLMMVFLALLMAFGGLWEFAFKDYQKERIMTFLNPLSDIQGAGYNAYQSTVAVGSGEIFGKGIGYGTQSKLLFLPEYETDFIFAAFAEEWGIVGVSILFVLFSVVILRLLWHAMNGASNFEKLFTTGVAIYLLSHFFIHVGINIGLLPVTGTTVPFLSYGGSHLVTEFAALGIVLAMRKYAIRRQFEQEVVIVTDETRIRR